MRQMHDGKDNEQLPLLHPLVHTSSFDVDYIDNGLLEFPLVPKSPMNISITSPRSATGKLEEELLMLEDYNTDSNKFTEFFTHLRLAYPISLTYLLEFFPGFVCIGLVGHLDSPYTKEYVAAATLSNMIFNVTGLSVALGLLSALSTLFSQSYGSKNYMKMGVYTQSALIIVAITLPPMALLNWHSEAILLAAGIHPSIAKLSGEFSKCTIIGMPALCVYEILRKLLQTQHIVHPFLYAAILGNIVNICCGYYIVFHTSLGFLGAAIGRVICNFTLPCLIIPYIWWTGSYKFWWPGWQWRSAVHHIPEFLSLGIPGFCMMAMSWWAYEILALMAGNLPDPVVSVSSHAVLGNISSCFYTGFLGISTATNIRVGIALGRNHALKAKRIGVLGVKMAAMYVGCISLVVFSFRYDLPRLFLDDIVAIKRVAQLLLIYVPFSLVDGSNSVLRGICRGIGKQKLAANIMIFCYYGVGIPSAYFFAFYEKLGVEGLWMGFGCGGLSFFLVFSIYLLRSNWQTFADEVAQRFN